MHAPLSSPVSGMKVAEITDRAAWESLEPVWNPLLAASASSTTFLTWNWLTAWWSAYGNREDLRILTASDENGIRGIAPLRRGLIRRYGQTFSTLSFVGDGSNDSDYLDFIVERGFENPVIHAWLRHIQPDLARGVILRLNEIPAGSPTLSLLKESARGQLWNEEAIPCATVHLPADWDGYLSRLRPRFRTRIRSVLRQLEAHPDVRFGFCKDEAEVERLLPALFDLHTRRWNHDGRPGVFGWDRKREFYRVLSPALLDQQSLRLSWLEWKGRILACQYGFIHGSTYLHLQEGYEPASEHWNVGVGLRAWTIREFLRAGVSEYDFLAGVGRHKSDWGADVKESRRVIVAASTYRNRLFLKGPEWQERAKGALKRFAPDRVLAMRQSGKRPAGAYDPGAALRRAAARCYLHLGMPAATQRLRKRYQVSVAPKGGLPRISWRRRQEATGRIFCYHRVNDDADPFFPSMPVATFEMQMRFVTRHHKVVSLNDLIVHLESGSPETVLAVTFDDGYRDNYQNAFPILERYGVPATIFLTTGCLDSGRAPWFEDLAAAVKATSREYLDVEIDIPRRLWMRTPEERLQSHHTLLALLRQLSNDDRETQLAVLLENLGRSDVTQRRDVMLTWDQVRHMKQHRVDFGGHTVTHPFLSRLPPPQVAWEISECKRRIESELQASVNHFAYPNGRGDDFLPSTKDAILASGYLAAVTTEWGLNYASTDRLELRRSGPWEEDEALFASKLDWYELVNG